MGTAIVGWLLLGLLVPSAVGQIQVTVGEAEALPGGPRAALPVSWSIACQAAAGRYATEDLHVTVQAGLGLTWQPVEPIPVPFFACVNPLDALEDSFDVVVEAFPSAPAGAHLVTVAIDVEEDGPAPALTGAGTGQVRVPLVARLASGTQFDVGVVDAVPEVPLRILANGAFTLHVVEDGVARPVATYTSVEDGLTRDVALPFQAPAAPWDRVTVTYVLAVAPTHEGAAVAPVGTIDVTYRNLGDGPSLVTAVSSGAAGLILVACGLALAWRRPREAAPS